MGTADNTLMGNQPHQFGCSWSP